MAGQFRASSCCQGFVPWELQATDRACVFGSKGKGWPLSPRHALAPALCLVRPKLQVPDPGSNLFVPAPKRAQQQQQHPPLPHLRHLTPRGRRPPDPEGRPTPAVSAAPSCGFFFQSPRYRQPEIRALLFAHAGFAVCPRGGPLRVRVATYSGYMPQPE